MKELSVYVSARAPVAVDDPEPSLNTVVRAGLILIIAFFGGGVGWSMFARLESAIIATGVVTVDSHRKTVQHLEGGIVREILVREGERVKAGQPLVYLDSTLADAALGQIQGQHWSVRARLARLKAEERGARTLDFPADLNALGNDQIMANILATQKRLFESRWRVHESQIAVLAKRIDQFKEEMSSSQSLHSATGRRLAFMQEELVAARGLLDKGFEKRPRVLDLERQSAELQGRLGDYRGAVARSREAIAGAELEIAGLRDSRLADIGKEMQEAQALETDLADRLRASADVQRRKEIVAPQDGVVVDLKFHTSGGVVGPGQPIMDIVPANDDLLVEARVSPSDVDIVRPGLPAEIRLTAYRWSRMPPLKGTVVTVSADKLTDQRTGEPYFTARVELARDSLQAAKGMTLSPGMPTEVVVVTGERRAIDYFIAPFTERIRRGLREN